MTPWHRHCKDKIHLVSKKNCHNVYCFHCWKTPAPLLIWIFLKSVSSHVLFQNVHLPPIYQRQLWTKSHIQNCWQDTTEQDIITNTSTGPGNKLHWVNSALSFSLCLFLVVVERVYFEDIKESRTNPELSFHRDLFKACHHCSTFNAFQRCLGY